MKKNKELEPEPLEKKNKEPEPKPLKNVPAPQPWGIGY